MRLGPLEEPSIFDRGCGLRGDGQRETRVLLREVVGHVLGHRQHADDAILQHQRDGGPRPHVVERRRFEGITQRVTVAAPVRRIGAHVLDDHGFAAHDWIGEVRLQRQREPHADGIVLGVSYGPAGIEDHQIVAFKGQQRRAAVIDDLLQLIEDHAHELLQIERRSDGSRNFQQADDLARTVLDALLEHTLRFYLLRDVADDAEDVHRAAKQESDAEHFNR